MIDRGHALSVTKQAEAIGIARSTVYYLPRPVSPEDLALMKQIDVLHLAAVAQRDLYNRRRPHSALDGRTPDTAYFGHESMPPIRLAA